MGGMPTPPPRSSARGRPGTASKGRPMGPMTLSRAPGRFPASSLVPWPTSLYRMSAQPAPASTRISDMGRRIASSGSQLTCTKDPGRARAAILGAWMRSRH